MLLAVCQMDSGADARFSISIGFKIRTAFSFFHGTLKFLFFNRIIMSTLLVALVVILGIAGLSFMLVSLHNRANKIKAEKLLRHFSESGTEHNLSFTSQEVLRNRIIGVDGLKGKVMFLEHSDADPVCSIIDLAQTKSCRVSKSFGNANAGDSTKQHADRYLHTIALEFDFRRGHTVALPFYNHLSDSIQDAAERETKAKNWEAMLLKMMAKERKTA